MKKRLKNLSKNYWAVATILLGALLVVLLILNSTSTISKSEAGQRVLDFAEQQGVEASLVDVKAQGSVYEVILNIEGQEAGVYITKDGENFVPQLIPLTGNSVDNSDSSGDSVVDVPKSDKPVVEMFIMSHCPYGTQIEKGMLPVARLLKDEIDFEIKFVYYAMHGEVEVNEQTRQYCIQEEQNDKYLDYLECFLEDGDSSRCLTETGIDIAAMESCVAEADEQFDITKNLEDESSWLSGRFPMYNVHLEDNEKYSVGGSPTLVINGVQASSSRDSASLLDVVCSAFNEAPEECDDTLSSAQPSPGFGFDTTSGDTTATCG